MKPVQSPNKFLLNSTRNLPYASKAIVFPLAKSTSFSGGLQHSMFLQTSRILKTLPDSSAKQGSIIHECCLTEEETQKFNFFSLKLCRRFKKKSHKGLLKEWHQSTLVPPRFLCLQCHPPISHPSHVWGRSPGWASGRGKASRSRKPQTARGHLAACSALPGRRADELFQQG